MGQKNTHEENTKICIGFSSHIRMKNFGSFKIKRKGAERDQCAGMRRVLRAAINLDLQSEAEMKGPNKLYELLCDNKAQTQENRIERLRRKKNVQ